jgi:acetate---CoA ligase (ADP-forming)
LSFSSRALAPRSIAVVGASTDTGKLSGRLLKILIDRGYPGRIYPVNPKYDDIAGLRCYTDIESIDAEIDMAVLVAPAALIPPAIEALGRKGVSISVVISSGFAEIGDAGKALERRVVDTARRHGMRVLGPNTIGVINAFDRMAATFTLYAEDALPPGPIAVVSQSGAFGAGMSALARRRGLGIGYFVATGNEADLELAEVLGALLDDPRIASVGGYVEGLKNGLPLVQAAQKALELDKPLVLVKVGRSHDGARAAASHTGALAVDDAVFDGIAKQYGIVRARNEEHLLDALQGVSFCGRPGPRLGVVTGSGGAGVLIADRATDCGLRIPPLAQGTMERLAKLVPDFGSLANPVDVSGQVTQNLPLLKEVLLAVLEDPAVDAGIFWTQMVERQSSAMVEALRDVKQASSKPFVVAWVAAPDSAIASLHAHGIAAFRGPEPAVDGIAAAVQFARVRERASWRTEQHMHPCALPEQKGAVATIAAAKLLGEAGVPLAKARFAGSADEAAAAASEIGYPVALKIESPDILHKTEVGGIRLNLADAQAVRTAYDELLRAVHGRMRDAHLAGVIVQEMAPPGVELVVGLQNDPAFGAVVMVGAGGVLIEVLRDVAIRKAPVSPAEAAVMLSELKISPVLDGVRGQPPADREAMAELIAAVSQFGAANASRLRELDLNPVFASPGRVVAVDWLLVLD